MKSEYIEKLKKIDDIKIRIKECEDFLNVFDSSKNIRRWKGEKDISGKITIEGNRWFGIGTAKVVIELPFDMIYPLESWCENELNKLNYELSQLINSE